MLVDAEHIYMQPAIDAITLEAQRVVHKGQAVVLNTSQCYLKSTPERLAGDMSLATRQGWTFGGKLVRGAYLAHEVAHAAAQGLPRPVHDSLEDTHACYDRCPPPSSGQESSTVHLMFLQTSHVFQANQELSLAHAKAHPHAQGVA